MLSRAKIWFPPTGLKHATVNHLTSTDFQRYINLTSPLGQQLQWVSLLCPCSFTINILGPLVGNTDSFVKNSDHFIQFIQEINLQNEDSLVSSNADSLFTNITVEEVLGTTANRCCSTKYMKENTLLNSTE
jgi:hypothetical protein